MITEYIVNKTQSIESLIEEERQQLIANAVDELLVEIKKVAVLSSQPAFYESVKNIDFDGFFENADFSYYWINYLSENLDDEFVKLFLESFEYINDEVMYFLENSEN